MKKRFVLFVILLIALVTAHGQPMQGYKMNASKGTYNEVTEGVKMQKIIVGEGFTKQFYVTEDDVATEFSCKVEGFPIGFDFDFNNQKMNRFIIFDDGCIALGKDSVNIPSSIGNPYFLLTTSSFENVIGATQIRGHVAFETTEVSYKVIGDAPNRTLVVQWKDLGLKKAFWGENYQACQLQVRLEETSNNIQIIFRDWKPEEDMTSSHSVRIGLRGTDSDYTLLNTDFDDPVLSSESTTAITWKTDSYPADGQTYTFTPPAACQTPAAQPTDLVLKATSTKLIGSFTKTENTDKYLTLISTSSELSEQPADGVLYAVGDNIGNATVLAFDTLNTFATKDILEGSNTYYIKIFSANTFCSYGPIYRLSEPLAAQISTKPTKPGELKVTKSTLNSAVLSAEANTSGDKVVVAMSTLPLYNVYDQLLMGGTFGELPANPSVGDEIEGGGKVIYVGESNDNIVLTDMQENIPYHFRSFSMDAAGTVSTTYSSTDILTGSHLPWIPNTSDFMYWEKSENFSTSTDILSDTVLFANLSSIPEGGNKEYVTTPWLKLDEGSNRIVMDVNFEKFAMWRWSPFNDWTENDTLYFQASIDGETFTDFHKIGKSEAPYIEELNAYVPLRIPFDIYAGKEVKLRIYWNTFDSPRIRMKNIRVEGVKDCDYPIDLKVVEGSIVSDKATIDWTRQGNENAWELRYRVEGSEAWSDILPVESKPYTISGLPGLQNIEVQVRAKCDATTNSDWSENFIFTSSYVVPFTEMFNYTEAPESWEMKSGKLATPTVFDDTNPLWQWYSTWSLKGFFFMNYGSTEIGEWIIGPQVDFGDGSVNYNITFDLIPVEGVTQKDATYSIVLSRDGGQTFNEDDVLAKFTDADFTEDYKAKSLTAKTKGVSGMVRPALYINAPGESMSLQLNSFSIQPTCVNDIDNIVVSDTTDSSVKVSWTTEAENTLIFIRKAGETVKPYEETTEKEKIFTGLDPRTDYEIGLTKSCGAGDTAAVTIVRVTTLAKAACPEVENIKVTPAKYSALIEWTAESSVYNVRYRKINDTEWTQKQVTDTCIVIENLMQDTDYEYAIQALCSMAAGDSSAYTAIDTLHTLVETCFPPKDITITAAWDTAVVKWIGEAGTYKLRYGKKGDENVVTETVSGDEYVLKGLTPEKTYVVAMQSICSETDESLWSEDVEFTTTAIPECVTPTNLAVGSITYESAVLTWDADESNLRWNIHFRKGSDAAWTTVEGLTEKSYTINNLDANESYIWSVMAECEAQNSTWATQNRFQTVVNAIESATLGKPQVFVRGGIVNVVNSERGYIESVSIYNEAGQLLKVCDAKTNDNLFIPVGTASQSMLIVKVKGSDKTFTVKLKR